MADGFQRLPAANVRVGFAVRVVFGHVPKIVYKLGYVTTLVHQ
jgi:hypothetical protein